MDKEDALFIAQQIREYLDYQGDSDNFDKEIVALIEYIVDECAKVVETTPTHLFLMSKDPRHIIAAAIRGGFKK